MFIRIRYAVAALVVLLPGLAVATSTRQMTFEEVVAAADVVVIGKIVESPVEATLDPSGQNAFRRHRVAVEHYVKGSGQDTVTVLTLGGQVEVNKPGEPRIQEIAYLGFPQLPEVGTQVLLFLKRSAGEQAGYQIYSATHGVLRVNTSSDGTRWVALAFKDPRVMPSTARAECDRATTANPHQVCSVIRDRVAIASLDLLARIALDPSEGEASKRVKSVSTGDGQ